MHASFMSQFLFRYKGEGGWTGGDRRVKFLNLLSKSIIHVDEFTMHACQVELRKSCFNLTDDM